MSSPLTSEEEAVWRALAKVVVVLPRLIDAELLRVDNLTLNEYMVLMLLSEAPKQARRMSDLTTDVPITPSGLTRLMERLERQGMVTKMRTDADGRGQLAMLTEAGMERLRTAWPGHLDSVRQIVLENLTGLDLPALTRALDAIASYQVNPGTNRRRA